MKISCNILKKHIKDSSSIDFKDVWNKFTIRTAEVEGVTEVGKDIDGIVTGKILTCVNHPESKKLHVLTVDVGDEVLQIVCGALNVRVGMIGACIKVGGHIGGITIEPRPLVGIMSYGMMCSGKEIGISDDHSGIIEFPEDTPVGVDIKKLFPIEDIIVEIDNKSLTHRPDLWGHYGIAREVAAITGHDLLPLELDRTIVDKKPLNIKIDNSKLCYRYVGTKIENITNNKTPMWMQIFLYYAGMRSINLLVDLTNYVMLELGQPMHAFDSRVVKDIEVGLANDFDTYTTLDGVQRKLTKDDLMIKNDGEYFAIAGVMGGLDSEILEDTDSIVLESATFEASTVRKTAVRLGLRTEASARYEKSLDPNMAITAARRFIKLLFDENPDAEYGSCITDVYPTIQKENEIILDKNYLYKYMGFNISDELVINILQSLDFIVKNTPSEFKITVPTFRSTKDITIAADVIEEISRMYGYENFEHVPLKMAMSFGNPEKTYDLEYKVKYLLATKYNLHEIHSYLWNKTSFLKKINVDVQNVKLLGKNDDNILRNDLNLSLLEASVNNSNNYDKFGIFEIGTIIDDNKSKRHLNILLCDSMNEEANLYYQLKDIVKYLFKSVKNVDVKFELGLNREYYIKDLTLDVIVDNVVVGKISVFNKNIAKEIGKKKTYVCADIDFDLFEEIDDKQYIYEDVSKYPSVNLDYTITVKNNTLYNDVEEILDRFSDDLIIKRSLKDIYDNGENKNITISYVVGSKDHTLSNEELANFKNKFISYIKGHNLNINE